MLLTNNRRLLGASTHARLINILGWGTTSLTFLATGWLLATWIR
jgi:hypothetical protein